MPMCLTPATEKSEEIKPLKPQTLGPKQIAWFEERFRFYGVYRAQAEAPTGVAAITPPQAERQEQ